MNVATGAAIGSVLRAGEATLEVAEDLRKVERAALSKEGRRHSLQRKLNRAHQPRPKGAPTFYKTQTPVR